MENTISFLQHFFPFGGNFPLPLGTPMTSKMLQNPTTSNLELTDRNRLKTKSILNILALTFF